MELITFGDTILAYLIRCTATHEKTEFPTPPDVELQVGFVVYPTGGVVKAHLHKPITRRVKRTCEVIVIKSGRCEVDLYAGDQRVVATRELSQGDVLILVNGGHGFRMKEDTVLLEVKQGPYYGEDEKKFLS